MTKIFLSPKFKMLGWDLITYLKKRKKTAITFVASIILYVMTDNAMASIIAGAVIEGIISIGEYYFNEIEM